MERRTQLVFLCLILTQAAHSVEECLTQLYAVFGPARFVSGLISDDLARGFLIANVAMVTSGLLCWAIPVRLGWRAARRIAWLWTVVELVNGTVHSVVAWWRGGYFPGVATAPFLLFFAGWLAMLLRQEGAVPKQTFKDLP